MVIIWLFLKITSCILLSSNYFVFLLLRARTCFMGEKDQNIALIHANKCLMGGKKNRFHVLVHALWAGKKAKNAFSKLCCFRTKRKN